MRRKISLFNVCVNPSSVGKALGLPFRFSAKIIAKKKKKKQCELFGKQRITDAN